MKNNKLPIAIILLVVAILLIFICPTISLMIPFSIVSVLLCITSLVLNHLDKKEVKEKKGAHTLCNIFGILILVFCLMELFSTILMTNPDMNEPICQREDMVSDCVDKGKGVSNCKYMKSIDIPCNNDALEDSQIK